MSKLKSTRVAITSLWRGQLSEYITSIAWSKDGEALVASSAGGEVVYWHGQQLISLLEPNGTTIDSLSFDASDRYLVAGGQTGDVRVWDCHNHQPKLLLSLPHKSIWIDTLKWHSDRPYLAFAITYGRLRQRSICADLGCRNSGINYYPRFRFIHCFRSGMASRRYSFGCIG